MSDSIGAFWKKDWGYSGVVTCPHCEQKIQLAMFTNKYKKESKHPDFQILKAKEKEDSN